ncbi:tetratricopeptide repeat protein [Nodosilinea sp. FACHB-131]|uniref:tetratricopeptide repeat protein n=1 Tax=Cyanophyceae TaxID=3028117 RepID=UPI00168879CD|nr:tetratricopeptide repeat protein [Nodosilinea sp. FACHB-131]MBD1876595.1 tetratricopeptide repeat protein [Nodosilinea sp. FACHB-131]
MNQEQDSSQAEYDYYWNLDQQERDQLLENEQTLDSIRVLLLFQQGLQLAKKEEFDAAIASYDKAVAIGPDHAWAWADRGFALTKLNRYEEAIDSYDKAVAIRPDHAWAWASRGIALAKLNRYEEAIDSYDKAVAIEPDRTWAWASRGIALANLNRYEEAIDSYDQALKLKTGNHCVWCKRAKALHELGRYEEAVLNYDKVLEQQSMLEPSCAWDKSVIIKKNNQLLSYLMNQWAPGKRTFWGNLRLIYFAFLHPIIWGNLRLIYLEFQFPIIFCMLLALIVFSKGTLFAQILQGGLYIIFTGLSILLIPAALVEFRKNIKTSCRMYFRSGILSYIRAFSICFITIIIGSIIYIYSPSFLRFGWGQLVFSNSGNWAITQPLEMANQAAETANAFQEHLATQTLDVLNRSEGRVSYVDFRWVFIPALWLLLILALPAWAKWEEEKYRKGIHTWKGITINSIKFGLAHLIMGIPICIGLSLSVPGFLFACRYRYVYQQHLRKNGNEQEAQEAGVFASTADHAIYNAILITLLITAFLF